MGAVTWTRGDDPVMLPVRLGSAAMTNSEQLVLISAEGEEVIGRVYGFGTDEPRTVVLQTVSGTLVPVPYEAIDEARPPELVRGCTNCGTALYEPVAAGGAYSTLCQGCSVQESDDSDDRDGRLDR